MRTGFLALAVLLLTGPSVAGPQSRTFTGVISDTMCVRDHTAMKVSPDSTCVRECVKASKDIGYMLIAGKNAYGLSDREQPAPFAGQRVRVRGVLQEETNIIQVESIEPLR